MSERIELNNPRMLTWARERAGLKHWQVADELGVSHHAIWSWEDGKRWPTYEQLQQLAELYGTNVATLFLPEPPGEPSEAERREQIIDELEYVRSLADDSHGMVLEAIDADAISEAIAIIREVDVELPWSEQSWQ